MKTKSLFLTLITLFLFCACKKDNDREPTSPTDKPSPSPTIEMPINKKETHYMLLSTQVPVGEELPLSVAVTTKADAENTWIDLNANGIKDEGEELIGFEKIEGVAISMMSAMFGLGDLKELHVFDSIVKHKASNIALYSKAVIFMCNSISINSLDISQNKSLMFLSCMGNNLNSLNISQNKNLGGLFCTKNELSSLDFSQNKKLKILKCEENKLTSLDLANCDQLMILECDENALTSLKLSKKNEYLNLLSCANNQLSSLDLPDDNSLSLFYIYDNKINKEAMGKIISKLPDWKNAGKAGEFFGVNSENPKNENEITDAQLEELKTKKWAVLTEKPEE